MTAGTGDRAGTSKIPKGKTRFFSEKYGRIIWWSWA
jgi:hypothetical protein